MPCSCYSHALCTRAAGSLHVFGFQSISLQNYASTLVCFLRHMYIHNTLHHSPKLSLFQTARYFFYGLCVLNPSSKAHFFPTNMNLPGFNSLPHTAATMPVSVRSNTVSFFEDPAAKKIRKPYTITKSRENWTEQEHDKFLEALHLFDRDWKKIEAFVGSKSVIQIRSHAQKYFLKVQKNGTNEHLPPPRPKRKANHPYPQKAPKSVALTSSTALLHHDYLYNPSSQPVINTTPKHGLVRCDVKMPNPAIKEELGVPENCCSTTSSRDKQRTRTVTETIDQESGGKPHRVMPNFAEVYSFIGSVFDPETTGHVQRLKQMDPINVETVLLLMKNLSLNLRSPEFEEQRRLLSSYNGKQRDLGREEAMKVSVE